MPSPEPAITPVVEAVWTQNTISSLKKLKKIQFELRNLVSETVSVDVNIFFMGLGDQEISDSLGHYALTPNATEIVTIDIRDLGIQAETLSSEAIVALKIERESGQQLSKFSDPLFYHFVDNYKSILAYDEKQMVRKFRGGWLDRDVSKLTGFKKDKSGNFVYIDNS